jgi:AcrR family transcriptional regulator
MEKGAMDMPVMDRDVVNCLGNKRAGDGIRTHEYHLGKVMPYHLATPANCRRIIVRGGGVVKEIECRFERLSLTYDSRRDNILNENSINKKRMTMSPRTDGQNQMIKDERREQIMHQAFLIFAKNGLAATKINDIAQSAHLSQGLVYHYFESKEDLFTTVIEQTVELSNRAMNQMAEISGDPIEVMRIVTERSVLFGDANEYALRWLLMLQTALSDSVPSKARELILNNFKAMSLVKKVIEEGQRRGQFTQEQSADQLTTLYWAMIQGLVFFRAYNRNTVDIQTQLPDIDAILKIIMK